MNETFHVPAASMRERARNVRLMIVDEHLLPRKAFPIAKALVAAHPTSDAAATALIKRGDLGITGDESGRRRVFNKAPSGSDTDAPFEALINDEVINIEVNFPVTIDIAADFNESRLVLEFRSKLLVTFINLPGNLQIPEQQDLDRISVSDAAILYELHEHENPPNKFSIQLDLMPKQIAAVDSKSDDRLDESTISTVMLVAKALIKDDPCSKSNEFHAYAGPMTWGPWVTIGEYTTARSYEISAEPETDTIIRCRVRYFTGAPPHQTEQEFGDSVTINTCDCVGTVEVSFMGTVTGTAVKGTINQN